MVESIPIVGGTKDLDSAKVEILRPDFLLLDREENPKHFADASKFPVIATHVDSIPAMARELRKLSLAFALPSLSGLAERAESLPKRVPPIKPPVLEWWREPESASQYLYLIWRNPWMTVGRETFIGSVLSQLGISQAILPLGSKYPEIDLSAFSPKDTALLFSTEPYPFARHKEKLLSLGHASALVDGESFSWFGIRSLEFLESQLT